MCVCGKRKGSLNTTNWTRHIKSRKKIKMTDKTEKIKITKYFSKPTCSKGKCNINKYNLVII